MSQTPETGAGKVSRGKRKPAPAIDLAPSEVSEIAPQPETTMTATGLEEPAKNDDPIPAGESAIASGDDRSSLEPEPSSAPDLPPPPPASGSLKLVPGLIGLVAGALGGFGAFYLGDVIRPKAPGPDSALSGRLGVLEQRLTTIKPGESVPPALIARLDKAEAMLAEAGTREARLQREVERLGAALAARPAAVGIVSGAAGASGEVEGLKSRVETIENTARALPQAVSALDSRIQSVQPKIDAVSKEVSTLSGKISGLAAREALGAAQARLAAVTLLQEALGAGTPLAQPVKMLKGLGIEDGALAAFAPFLDKAAPDEKTLLAELRALKPQPKPEDKPANLSFLDRVRTSAAALVEVRKTGTITGTDDAAHLARAARALEAGDAATAITLVGRLSAGAAPAYAGWLARAGALITARGAARVQRGEALAALAQAAAAK